MSETPFIGISVGNVPVQMILCSVKNAGSDAGSDTIFRMRRWERAIALALDASLLVSMNAGDIIDRYKLSNLWTRFDTDQQPSGSAKSLKILTSKDLRPQRFPELPKEESRRPELPRIEKKSRFRSGLRNILFPGHTKANVPQVKVSKIEDE